MTTFLSNRSIYESVICGIAPEVRERLWIATAEIKDIVEQFDSVWRGAYCRDCGRREFCGDCLVEQSDQFLSGG